LKASVIDTNVIIVANGKSTQADIKCVRACIESLNQIHKEGMVVLDDGMRILDEYRRNLSLSGQHGLGDAFFKWVWDNQANEKCCERVTIHFKGISGEDYLEFPSDKELKGFDRSDRKFVAVAISSKHKPEILNAVDHDWWQYKSQLEKHNIRIKFLCPCQFDQ
jgi:hypothetical protein